MFQTKDQNKSPEKICEVKIGNLFREFRRRLDEQTEKLENFLARRNCKEEREFKNAITEMKNTLD